MLRVQKEWFTFGFVCEVVFIWIRIYVTQRAFLQLCIFSNLSTSNDLKFQTALSIHEAYISHT